jgi:ATP-dependent DNA ligase
MPINPKAWHRCDLEGTWEVTKKIDGIRALVSSAGAFSKRGKPLLHLENVKDGDYEVFIGSWGATSSILRSHDSDPIRPEYLYSLDPVDKRLQLGMIDDPTADQINDLLAHVRMEGYEGLVLRQGDTWIKVKASETYDVPVIGINLSDSASYAGLVKSLITPMGNVNVAKPEDREEFLSLPMNTVIEVECMELTENGKFRHARLIRVRWDK